MVREMLRCVMLYLGKYASLESKWIRAGCIGIGIDPSSSVKCYSLRHRCRCAACIDSTRKPDSFGEAQTTCPPRWEHALRILSEIRIQSLQPDVISRSPSALTGPV